MRKNFWSFFISMPATVLIYMPLILLWLEYRQWPLAGFSWWRYGAAFVLLWGGVIFCLWAYFSLMREGEAEVKNFRLNSRKLVTEGPYRFVRNPMALGTGAILAGEALYFGSWYIFIWALVVIEVMSYYITHVEEYKLANKFGQSYINYKLDVGKWCPRKIIFKEWLKRK